MVAAARDCAFYVLDLVVLFVFFLDQKIEVYESLTLLALYVCYVFFMKHNQRAERWFKTRVLRVKPSDFDREKVQDAARKAMDREAAEAHIEADRLKSLKNADTDSVGHSSLASGRSGSLRSASSRQLSRKLRGNSVRGALSLLDADGRPQSPGILATEPAVGPGHPALIGVGSAGSKPHGNKVSAEPAPFDFGVDKNELRKAAAERARAAMDAVSAAEDEDDEGIDLSWPEDRGGQVYYVIACPLMFLLAYTIPNCKKRPTLWPVVFLLSILYIGVFSYFMVWWATSVGAVAGISDVVMGYTFLAAGTSVPDLMSSVIVARQGLGDMAVSSSIGSNIFDITFGLPLPWLIWSLANGFETFPVNSDSLGFSLTLLIIMLVAVVSIIAQQGWMMTKTLGAMMVALYGVFLLLVLLNAGGHAVGSDSFFVSFMNFYRLPKKPYPVFRDHRSRRGATHRATRRVGGHAAVHRGRRISPMPKPGGKSRSRRRNPDEFGVSSLSIGGSSRRKRKDEGALDLESYHAARLASGLTTAEDYAQAGARARGAPRAGVRDRGETMRRRAVGGLPPRRVQDGAPERTVETTD